MPYKTLDMKSFLWLLKSTSYRALRGVRMSAGAVSIKRTASCVGQDAVRRDRPFLGSVLASVFAALLALMRSGVTDTVILLRIRAAQRQLNLQAATRTRHDPKRIGRTGEIGVRACEGSLSRHLRLSGGSYLKGNPRSENVLSR
jgi:hypothetical protein